MHRSAQKAETSLLACSRQRLPRPHRYASTSRPVRAPAAAVAEMPANPSFEPFLSYPPNTAGPSTNSANSYMHQFFQKPSKMVVLPTPLPSDIPSTLENSQWFLDTQTQERLAVMEACLHNLFDVPRATGIFNTLRADPNSAQIIEPRIYNTFLEAYIESATRKANSARSSWIQKAVKLFQDIEESKGLTTPGTYATMLLGWLRFRNHADWDASISPNSILQSIHDAKISLAEVAGHRVFTSHGEAKEAILQLSHASADLGLHKLMVPELGRALGSGDGLASSENPVDNVPEVNPTTAIPAFKTTGVHLKQIIAGEPLPAPAKMHIPFNLDNLRRHLAEVNLSRRVLSGDPAARQRILEESVYDTAAERWKRDIETVKKFSQLSPMLQKTQLQSWMSQWHECLTVRLTEQIQAIKQHEEMTKGSKQSNVAHKISPFLHLLKPEKLSLITILEVMRLQDSGGIMDGMKTTRALVGVGRAVENEHKAQTCKPSQGSVPMSGQAFPSGAGAFFTPQSYNSLKKRRLVARQHSSNSEEWVAEWSQAIRVRVASILVDSLMSVAKVMRTMTDSTGKEISEEHPAFSHGYEYVRGMKIGVIRLNEIVAKRMSTDNVSQTLHPRHLPMLIPPKPWVSENEGGYLYNESTVMRYKDSKEQRTYLRQAAEQGNMELVFAGLDVLGTTPWQINRPIFDVVLKVWNSGSRLGKIPPAQFDEPEPEKPANICDDQNARSKWLVKYRLWGQRKANSHTDRCGVNYKLEIARSFLGDTLYFPHNVDFRGRAYPLPPHLNHLGDDLSRGLLTFAESKPLGVAGYKWLKIHLANLYGFDKANFEERVAFVDTHLEDIYDSAEKPLDGKRWWTKADDPWQCLAACMELRAAIESGNPLEYKTSIPVHQDGTCNGLQHYAALGGDPQGAAQVNLSNSARPSDVYTHVAGMVEALIEEDLAKGDPVAAKLKGKIARKVVKQTVMTTVYGVTFVGAREQIAKQLHDRADIDTGDVWECSTYIAKKVLHSITNLFGGAKAIQTWLTICARLISKAIPSDRVAEAVKPSQKSRTKTAANRVKQEQMASVIWTTPMGLPVVQPYRKANRSSVKTSLQSVFITDPNVPTEVDSMKQAGGFPPNFIHSLDATHMMLTALECRAQNLTFASVHDSYWTHPCDIDAMSLIIRDTFIELHQSNVLQRLEEEFRTRYAGYKVPLSGLKSGSFLNNLVKAGLKLKMTAKQASRLGIRLKDQPAKAVTGGLSDHDLSDHVEVVNDEDKSTDGLSDVLDLINLAPVKKRKSKSASLFDMDSDLLTEGKEEVGDMDSSITSKFISVTDLFPPLPPKGTFDVEDIKKSRYFFS